MSSEVARSHDKLRWAVGIVSQIFAVASSLLVLVITLIIVADVGRRYFTGRSLPGVVEYSEVLMVAVIYLGLAYAQRRGDHIGVDLFVKMLPHRAGQLVKATGLAIVSLTMLLIFWQTSIVAQRSYLTGEYRFGLSQVPVWPARIIIPLGIGVLLLEVMLDILDLLRGHDPKASVRDTVNESIDPVVSRPGGLGV